MGQKAQRQQLDSLAMAGQGHSRVLLNAEQAQDVIDKELFASSRTVAKAVRLSIRLGKGVHLIDIIDSHPLDEAQSQRVRQAEQSIDKKLSAKMGIHSDRGEDEEGIQIVIPNFYAGDSHVILLDLVVDQPGTIAEVSARYKDIIYLRNSQFRDQLNLSQGNTEQGPLQLNVSKNILSKKTSKTIKEVSHAIAMGNKNDDSIDKTQHLQLLHEGLRQLIPLWRDDPAIIDDEKLLLQIYNQLASAGHSTDQQDKMLSELLNYISWRKWNTEDPLTDIDLQRN